MQEGCCTIAKKLKAENVFYTLDVSVSDIGGKKIRFNVFVEAITLSVCVSNRPPKKLQKRQNLEI